MSRKRLKTTKMEVLADNGFAADEIDALVVGMERGFAKLLDDMGGRFPRVMTAGG